jgi:exodeoxyribonuclease-3
MKLVSWNVNGIRAISKKGFTDMRKEIDADVLCLQETKAQVHQVEEALDLEAGLVSYANEAERKGYSGTALITKSNPSQLIYKLGVEEHDKEGRITAAEFPDFYLVNVYTPNSGNLLVRLDYRVQWDKDFLIFIKALESHKPVIICGDLNVAHQPIDLKHPKSNYNKTSGYTQKEIDGLSNILNEGYIDSFRFQHPETVAYSYWSFRMNARANNVGWRIDYFLVSDQLKDKIKSSFILKKYEGSDHCPVGIEIEL